MQNTTVSVAQLYSYPSTAASRHSWFTSSYTSLIPHSYFIAVLLVTRYWLSVPLASLYTQSKPPTKFWILRDYRSEAKANGSMLSLSWKYECLGASKDLHMLHADVMGRGTGQACTVTLQVCNTAPSLRLLILNCPLIRRQSVQVYYHHLHPWMSLDLADHIIDLGDHLAWAFPGWLELRWLSYGPGWAVQPDLLSFLESHGIDQAVVAGLHLVTGHLQMLSGIIMDVTQSIHKVQHIVNHRLLLVRGSSKQRTTGQT
jgi:hypothetical protein